MSDKRDPERDQRLPVANDSMPITIMVINDLRERMEHGKRKYGTALQAHNGRDPRLDLYEELMDAICYLKQDLVERPPESEPS